VSALCVADGIALTPSQKDVVIRSMLTFYAAHAGGLAVSWCLHTAKRYPCLTGVLRMMLDELKLGEPWDVCRVEEEIQHAQFKPPSPPTHRTNAHHPSGTLSRCLPTADRRYHSGVL
jgi:hypothetical protein